jgi:ubiquinone/menaquinone biosynthesis C-methylase UbiE
MIAEEVFTEHKQQVARTYNMAASGYDKPTLRFFPACARSLVEALGLREGQKVLDVATGTGAAALAASRKVGVTGAVTGVDIAGEMLEQARLKSDMDGLNNIEWREMDAERLEFSDSTFDAVLSSFGIFFIEEMLGALREWRRVTRHGGVLAFTGFAPSAFQPQSDLFEARLRSYGITFPLAHRPFSWQRLDREEQYEELLSSAGCVNIKLYREQHGYFLSGASEWWEIICGSGFRGAVARLQPEQVARFKAEHLAEIRELETDAGLWLDVETVFALGQKP